MTQVLNSVVLKGDETYRTMQELAKLTNDQDQVSLDQLVKRLQNKFQLLLDENQQLSTEKELKLIPRIEQLLRENEQLRAGSAIEEELHGVIVQNEYLQEQIKELKMNHQASYKTREEKAELLMTIDQLRDEKEDLVNKAINLSQSIKTLKSELNSREDIANNLKRENKDLK